MAPYFISTLEPFFADPEFSYMPKCLLEAAMDLIGYWINQ